MNHTIKLKNGKFIYEKRIVEEIINMLHNGMDYTYIDGKKVSVYSDLRNSDGRVTVVEVEA